MASGKWRVASENLLPRYLLLTNLLLAMESGLQTNQEENKAVPFTFDLSFLISDFQQEWGRCNMAANYIAAYAAYQFPQRERVENLISTIANEMLETAVFLAPSHSDLQIRYTQLDDGLHMNITHDIRGDAITPYFALLDVLRGGHSNALYLKLLTDEEESSNNFNQLGLTMICNDFGARLNVKLENKSDRVQTQLFIPIKELSA